MKINSASLTIVTEKLQDTRQFYEKHFGARPIFDCGWYVVLRFQSSGAELCLMEPSNGLTPYAGGAFFNLAVESADIAHANIIEAGISITIPIEDHPWGDRGFGLLDPSGLVVYCYHPIKPAPEFDKCFVENHQNW